MSEEKKDFFDKLVERWWACVLLGVLLIGLTWNEYGKLAKLESGEIESMFVSRTTKVLYDLGGKTTCAVVGGLLSAGLIGYGVYLLLAKKKQST